MEWYWILLLLLGSILILMFAGLPVGIAFVIVCTVTAYLIYGRFGSFDANLEASVFQLTDNAFNNLSIFATINRSTRGSRTRSRWSTMSSSTVSRL